MILDKLFDHTDLNWQALVSHTAADEKETVQNLLQGIPVTESQQQAIAIKARTLVTAVRANKSSKGTINSLLCQYHLSSEEGIALMCLAEALLRIPDASTRDRLIQDKLAKGQWDEYLGKSDSLFVNAATWSLLVTGKILKNPDSKQNRFKQCFQKLVQRSSGWVIRQAVNQMIGFLSEQFVLADTIKTALKRAQKQERKGFRYSFDMLGEAALTAVDAARYYKAYEDAITQIASSTTATTWYERPGISIKLSALHPRYDMAQRDRVLLELTPRLKSLVQLAKDHNIGVTIDAEEATRLTLSLEIFSALMQDGFLEQWNGFGLAVQAYQKRASYVIAWLKQLSEKVNRRIPIRLIKGAYWDNEIKWAQELGLSDYPVFTRKVYTDVSYIYCAQQLLKAPQAFYCQFATHNAHTVATILTLTESIKSNEPLFEFQCLHGMGQQLYEQIATGENPILCRVYAPVGAYQELLPYLVRRLLENGANTSFVHRIMDESIDTEMIIADPLSEARGFQGAPHVGIPLPKRIYGERLNSSGIDLSCEIALNDLTEGVNVFANELWQAKAAYAMDNREPHTVFSPTDNHTVGQVLLADDTCCDAALQAALLAQFDWGRTSVMDRAACLERAADLLTAHQNELMALLIREAGKTLNDALAEAREAVDFCRYYAMQARLQLAPITLPGPTGEKNVLQQHGRGIILCISPWNFPLAIFMGQVSAALVTGNAVLAKPAEQTPLIAARAIALLKEAGIPERILSFLPGSGEIIGARLVADPRVSGVMFTGSTATAKLIQQSLAAREGPIVPLIAETGGQNAMIVDASALPEQVVQDVVLSAFGSAGQRCSALRVLFVQSDVADHIIELLCGAMAELEVGDPAKLITDVGPVIDKDAWLVLSQHLENMRSQAKLLYQVELNEAQAGTFIAPTVFEIQCLDELTHEVFGPILHVIRYNSDQLDSVISQINATGYGLTLGIHSRIERVVDYISQRIHAGNHYVNRNMIGAVVGVQPFGGQGLSGTGPKAGGPYYLSCLCHERTISIDTTAAGGNTTLLSLEDDD